MAEQSDTAIMNRYPADGLRALVQQAAENLGAPPHEAFALADTLVSADLRGVTSHGLVRTPIYLRRIRDGGCLTPTVVAFLDDESAVTVLNGGGGIGQVVALRAIESAIERARRHGVGLVAVRNSNHFGAAAYYAMKALDHDMIGIAMTNAAPAIAPWGGIDRKLGNNPFAVAVPAGQAYPVVLDMAQTLVARGWIKLAAIKGELIPEGWAMDSEGRPTTDANAALDGLLAPMGGYKGYGLSVLVEILSGVLSGAAVATELQGMGFTLSAGAATDDASADVFRRPENVGHFIGAIDISRFSPVPDFKARVDALVENIKSSRKSAGTEEIFLPGEKEWRAQADRSVRGIPLADDVVADLRAIAAEHGLAFPEAVGRVSNE